MGFRKGGAGFLVPAIVGGTHTMPRSGTPSAKIARPDKKNEN
jgi:hypothetical protein